MENDKLSEENEFKNISLNDSVKQQEVKTFNF